VEAVVGLIVVVYIFCVYLIGEISRKVKYLFTEWAFVDQENIVLKSLPLQ
jgi:hypothetical protein